MNENLRVAIIGAGVSGIFTAIELKKLGYGSVTLYEKSDRVASLTKTIEYDRRQFDLSTKVIPSMGLTYEGVYPPLLELLESTGVTLRPFPLASFYDFDKDKPMPIPAFMQQYGKLKVVKDFAKAYQLLLEISRCESFEDLYKSGLVRQDESVEEWAKRNGIEAFGAFSDYLVDLFNMGPSHQLPASYMLVSRVHSAVPYLHALLSKNGVRQYYRLFGSKNKPEFKRFLNYANLNFNYYVIKEGYQEFLHRLVKQYDLNVECGSSISELKKEDDELSFIVNGGSKVYYDRVIFCCPPPDIAMISYLPEVKTLLKDIKPERKIRTWAFETTGWDEKKYGKVSALIDGNNRLGLATKNLKINGELNYILKEIPDSNLIVCAVYMEHDMSEEAALDALKKSLKRFGLELKNVVTHQDFIWPHSFSLEQHKAGMNVAFQKYQGHDNIYYYGECFFGIGVPTILEFTKKSVAKHFAMNIETALRAC